MSDAEVTTPTYEGDVMPHPSGPGAPRQERNRLSLNTDGRRHPWLNGAAVYAVSGGLVSLVLGMMNRDHFAGSLLGVTGFLIGMWAQLVSATRQQRMVIVFGIVASFVGMGLGIAHGGFSLG